MYDFHEFCLLRVRTERFHEPPLYSAERQGQDCVFFDTLLKNLAFSSACALGAHGAFMNC